MAGRRSEKERLRRERLEREKQAKRAQQRRRRLTQAGAAFVGLLVVAVAAVAIAGGGDGDETTAGGTAAPESIADVHGLGVNPADKALYIATHSGLFRSAPGESTATRVDAPEQDLMGFSIAGPDHFVASGHPGPGMDAPPNLGMIESTDRGRTWRTLSLSGEADPADDEHVLASTGGGVRASSDGGRTWTDTTLAAPALLAWAQGAGPFAIDGNGRVLRSRDGGMKWKAGGTYQGQPAAFAADASDTIYVALGDGAVEASIDGGRTWQPRSRN
jgi:photosystem II stability/assembly factor-like uncharacterized protein